MARRATTRNSAAKNDTTSAKRLGSRACPISNSPSEGECIEGVEEDSEGKLVVMRAVVVVHFVKGRAVVVGAGLEAPGLLKDRGGRVRRTIQDRVGYAVLKVVARVVTTLLGRVVVARGVVVIGALEGGDDLAVVVLGDVALVVTLVVVELSGRRVVE